MNQKKCKRLRKMVREEVPVTEEPVYLPYQPVIHSFEEELKVGMNVVGTIKRLNDKGESVDFKIVRHKGTPCVLGECKRNVYQEKKKHS